MKKSLLVLATLAATAGFAQAASVSLYGAADLGLVYKYNKDTGMDASHSYQMKSGNLGSSKFGFKGSEDLGNGYSVGFKLENGFMADTGTLKGAKDGRIFDREASLTLTTPFGSLSAGRMGALSSGAGTYDIFLSYADVFDGGVADIGAGYWHGTARYDNMFTYVTPDMNGLKVYLQYGLQNSGTENASVRDNDRYWGLGVTFDHGPLGLVAVVDSVMPQHKKASLNQDAFTVSLGGHYDLGGVTPFVGVQYGKHMQSFGFVNSDLEVGKYKVNSAYVKGYALSLGSSFDLPAGTLRGVIYYSQAKGLMDVQVGNDHDIYNLKKGSVLGVGAVYSYPLSKRTKLYTGAGFNHQKYTAQLFRGTMSDSVKSKNAEVVFGINHAF